MEINIPESALVLLIGASGSGKSTFAKKYFSKHEIVSSDICRGMVSNDESNQNATKDAFDLLYYIVGKRLKKGLLTVVDATNVQADSRKGLIGLARKYHTLPVAIILDIPQSVCEQRLTNRDDKSFGHHVIKQQCQHLKKSHRWIKKEGFSKIYHLKNENEVDAIVAIKREKLYSNKKHLNGPFDIVGDIHGCYDELLLLLRKLGYTVNETATEGGNYGINVCHKENRQVIFLGDLVDRGPSSPAVLKLVMSMVNSGAALCVPGNHDLKLQRKLSGRNVQIKNGLAGTLEQLEAESEGFITEVSRFLYGLISHYVLDDGKLVVAHAGIKEELQGRGSNVVRSFCLYGETTGEVDEFGLPIRHEWSSEYRGAAKVIYGHTPVLRAQWLNNTLNIDTGCVFGGALTALRYPEEELMQVAAKKAYTLPIKPFLRDIENDLSDQQKDDGLLNISDFMGKKKVETRLRGQLTIRNEGSIDALEGMSRFAVNPKWLIYLPPTMSPCEVSPLPDFLEHPDKAINYYKKRGVEKVVCQEKHMGSRVILIICKNQSVVLKRFGIENEGVGICYTRTGRNFFRDKKLEDQFIELVQKALTKSNFWDNLNTDWVCLDAELMPWSAKAQGLIKQQYAAVGTAAKHALSTTKHALAETKARGILGADELLNKIEKKETNNIRFIDAYRNYCWQVASVDDYKLAPFHILATEGAVHIDKSHAWHMTNINDICSANQSIFSPTSYKTVLLHEPKSVQNLIQWWNDLTVKGGEGIVIKPMEFVTHGKDGLLQPAIKCRGKEYLRIIYGSEYDLSENMEMLKKRSLSKKRSLALNEFALGIEALERFIRKEPLRRIHACAFGVLAMESEILDPRL